MAVLDAEAQAQNLFLTRRQSLKHLNELLLEQHKGGRLCRFRRVVVRDEVAEVRILLLADRRLKRYRLLRDLQDVAHTVNRHVHLLGDLLRAGIVAQLLQQLAGNADNLVDGLNHVYRNTDRTRLIRNRTGDRLTDPPRCVGRELKALGAVELLNCLDQTEVALLDQIEKQHAAADIALCDRDNQSQVRLSQALLGTVAELDILLKLCALLRRNGIAFVCDTLCGLVALLHALCERYLLLRGQQIDLADLLQIHADRIVNGERFSHGRGIDQFFLRNLFHFLRLKGVVIVTDDLLQHTVRLDLDAHGLERLVHLVDVLARQLQMAQCIRDLLEGQSAVLLAKREQVAQDLLLCCLLLLCVCGCICVCFRHIVCPPAFCFLMRPNVSSGSSPACVMVPSLTRCIRMVFMYSCSSPRCSPAGMPGSSIADSRLISLGSSHPSKDSTSTIWSFRFSSSTRSYILRSTGAENHAGCKSISATAINFWSENRSLITFSSAFADFMSVYASDLSFGCASPTGERISRRSAAFRRLR